MEGDIMDRKEYLINLINMMVGLTDGQKSLMKDMDIDQLEEKYVLALQEKNDEMRYENQ